MNLLIQKQQQLTNKQASNQTSEQIINTYTHNTYINRQIDKYKYRFTHRAILKSINQTNILFSFPSYNYLFVSQLVNKQVKIATHSFHQQINQLIQNQLTFLSYIII
ncbi:hypothetical protein ABPG72_018722 [Tetrahymena utriculariae]